MKVKGIESALSGFRLGKHSRLQSATERPTLRVAILFAITLSVFLFAVAPYRAIAFADDKEDDAREKIHREARKAIRKGKYERAVELYRELLDKEGKTFRLNSARALLT